MPSDALFIDDCSAEHGRATTQRGERDHRASSHAPVYGSFPARTSRLSAVPLIANVGGALAGGKLAEIFYGRGNQARVMLPAVVMTLLCGSGAFMATMPNLVWFAASIVPFNLSYGVGIGIEIITTSLCSPNELRGTVIGLNIVVMGFAGAASGLLIALASHALGGEKMPGETIALVGTLFALLDAFGFWRASSSSDRQALKGWRLKKVAIL